MSSLIDVNIKRVDKRQLMIRIRDIQSEANNVGMIEEDREEYEEAPGISPFMLGLLLEGADGYHGEIPEFITAFKRAEHLYEEGTLEGFDESELIEYIEPYSVDDEELLEQFIESSEIVELVNNDFWDNYEGGDFDEEELPYVKVRVTLKEEKWAARFDGVYYETAFDITQ